jgi:hypothetical protein
MSSSSVQAVDYRVPQHCAKLQAFLDTFRAVSIGTSEINPLTKVKKGKLSLIQPVYTLLSEDMVGKMSRELIMKLDFLMPCVFDADRN